MKDASMRTQNRMVVVDLTEGVWVEPSDRADHREELRVVKAVVGEDKPRGTTLDGFLDAFRSLQDEGCSGVSQPS